MILLLPLATHDIRHWHWGLKRPRTCGIGSIGPKNITRLGNLFGLPDRAVMLAVSDFASRLDKAHSAVDASKNIGRDIKDKLHQQMEKRWNGTFDSIGTYLSKRQ